MASETKRVLMIGLPQTGKTTFLAALWYAVNNPDEVQGALRLKELFGEDTHLDQIRQRWLMFDKMDRTKMGFEHTVTMRLQRPAGEASVDVSFPDLSGERFRQQVEERVAAADYFDELAASAGAMLFIHSGDIRPPSRIDEMLALAQELEKPQAPEGDSEPSLAREWEPSMAPTQVKNVELLQVILQAPELGQPYKVAVVLSAWDKVEDQGRTPEQYLSRSMPLLDQFLASQGKGLQVAVFGVSAQGGDLDTPQGRQELIDRADPPGERVRVAFRGTQGHDISLPLKWLMGWLDDAAK